MLTNFREQSTTDVLKPLIEDTYSSEEVSSIPHSLARVMTTLYSDYDRMYGALMVANTFDLFETADTAIDLIPKGKGERFLLEVSSLCNNPATDQNIIPSLLEFVNKSPTPRKKLIRFDPTIKPQTDTEEYLYTQCWPGVRGPDNKFPTAPVVVLDCLLDPVLLFKLAVRIRESSAKVHRLSPDVAVPLWFGHETILICEEQTRQRVLNSYPDYPERLIITDPIPTAEQDTTEFLYRMDSLFPDKSMLML